jgi:cytochrome c oxidase cbb3-type subunit III
MTERHAVDPVTGVETTGHEWDGLRELNNPLPRWWIWTFYITIIWAIGYWIAMPSWPLIEGHTKGVLGYSSRESVAVRMAEAAESQGAMYEQVLMSSLEEIKQDSDMLEFALAGGRSAFAVNCSQCHGSGAAGSPGYPNLNDDEWLWGGALSEIHYTIRHGIRFGKDDATRVSEMPRFGADGILSPDEIELVAEYVLSLSGVEVGNFDYIRGTELFADNCAACHGDRGDGSKEFGAPSLIDAIWLYGDDKESIVQSIANSRAGVMPGWGNRLDPGTIKQLTVYVHSLGGGE